MTFFDRVLMFFRREKHIPIDLPQILRMQVHKYPCAICRQGLEDGDAIIRSVADDHSRYSDLSHLQCALIVRKADGTCWRDGKRLSQDEFGGIVDGTVNDPARRHLFWCVSESQLSAWTEDAVRRT